MSDVRLYHVNRLDREFQNISPVFKDTIAKARLAGPEWELEVDDLVSKMWPTEAVLAAAVKGYESFALEIMRLQVDFERTHVYAPYSYMDMLELVYDNDEYMQTCYLPGLLLAWYLWPHHYRQLRFFQTFVRSMARASAQRFIDVATGTGIYSRLALLRVPTTVGVGYDISTASCQFTTDHLTAFGVSGRYQMVRENVIEETPEPVDWLICVELIEHLSRPQMLIAALRRMLNPGGKAFLATAINAPNSDHIYLLRSVDEAASLITEGGFRIEQISANVATSSSKTPPTVVAFICS